MSLLGWVVKNCQKTHTEKKRKRGLSIRRGQPGKQPLRELLHPQLPANPCFNSDWWRSEHRLIKFTLNMKQKGTASTLEHRSNKKKNSKWSWIMELTGGRGQRCYSIGTNLKFKQEQSAAQMQDGKEHLARDAVNQKKTRSSTNSGWEEQKVWPEVYKKCNSGMYTWLPSLILGKEA